MLRHLIKANLKRTIFANEKPFKLQTPYDTQNNWVYAKHRKKKQILDVKALWCLLEYPCAVRQVSILLSQKCGWMGCTFAHKCRKSLSPSDMQVVSQFYSSTRWCEVPNISIHTALHPLSYPQTAGTWILTTSQLQSQPFKLLSLGLCHDCVTQSSER